MTRCGALHNQTTSEPDEVKGEQAALTMNVKDSRDSGDGVADLVERDRGGDSLQEDEGCRLDYSELTLERYQYACPKLETDRGEVRLRR